MRWPVTLRMSGEQVPPKLFGVNSWISQMIKQWIPECWSGDRKCTCLNSQRCYGELARNWQLMTFGKSQMPATRNFGDRHTFGEVPWSMMLKTVTASLHCTCHSPVGGRLCARLTRRRSTSWWRLFVQRLAMWLKIAFWRREMVLDMNGRGYVALRWSPSRRTAAIRLGVLFLWNFVDHLSQIDRTAGCVSYRYVKSGRLEHGDNTLCTL